MQYDDRRDDPPSMFEYIKKIQDKLVNRNMRVACEDNPRIEFDAVAYLELLRKAYRLYGFTRNKRIKWFLYGTAKGFHTCITQDIKCMPTLAQLKYLHFLARVPYKQ